MPLEEKLTAENLEKPDIKDGPAGAIVEINDKELEQKISQISQIYQIGLGWAYKVVRDLSGIGLVPYAKLNAYQIKGVYSLIEKLLNKTISEKDAEEIAKVRPSNIERDVYFEKVFSVDPKVEEGEEDTRLFDKKDFPIGRLIYLKPFGGEEGRFWKVEGFEDENPWVYADGSFVLFIRNEKGAVLEKLIGHKRTNPKRKSERLHNL